MTAHDTRNRRILAPMGFAALTALAVVGCSSPSESSTATTVTVTPAAESPAPTAQPAPMTTVTVVAPPPAAPPSAVPNYNTVAGPFESPSGNIVCHLYTATGDKPTAICAAAEHDWLAPKPENCGVNWGSRIDLEAGSPARFGCYGQPMPPATHTLEYGQTQEIGSISCTSAPDGIKCVDNASGHFLRISRQEYRIG